MQTEHTDIQLTAQKILSQVRQVVVGKDHVITWALAAILAQGHILLEDIPGVGKTTLALAFSKTLGLSHNRMQFTPDVLPSDVTGYNVLSGDKVVFRPGAVMCNLFLADELNRATSRTQSALLEAMEEHQVTVDGVSHKLPQPFVVMATQNPAGAAGTQLLPDSQMDRFLVRLSLGYPSFRDEAAMVTARQGQDPMESLQTILDTRRLQQLQQQVAQLHVSQSVVEYAVELIQATRTTPLLTRGASPRATLAVVSMAKAVAALRGRDYVIPKDVQEVLLPTVAHRLQTSPKAQAQGMQANQVLQELLRTVQEPALR